MVCYAVSCSAALSVYWFAWIRHLRMVLSLAMAAAVTVAIVLVLQGRFVMGPCKTEGEREYARNVIEVTNPFVLCVLGGLGHIRPHFTTTLVAVHCTIACVGGVLAACVFCIDAAPALLLTWTVSYFIGAGLMAELLSNTDWRGFYRRVCVGWLKGMAAERRADYASSMDCCVCWGALERAAMLNNCGHVLCVDCAHGLASCPKCRAHVTGFRRVFL